MGPKMPRVLGYVYLTATIDSFFEEVDDLTLVSDVCFHLIGEEVESNNQIFF
jgi:hypothetical protein